MGNRIVNAIRNALGMTQPAPHTDHASVIRRLNEQTVRLRAIDAKIDADFPDRKITFHRRASDR